MDEQPAVEPVTVYIVVDVGFTFTVLLVTLPALALHVYVVAPLAIKWLVCPLHNTELLGVILMEGIDPPGVKV